MRRACRARTAGLLGPRLRKLGQQLGSGVALSLREPVSDKDDSLTALPMAEPMSRHLLVVLIDRRLGLQGERTHFIQRCLDDPHLNGITPPVHSRASRSHAVPVAPVLAAPLVLLNLGVLTASSWVRSADEATPTTCGSVPAPKVS
jgi:hypothetical protein